MLKKMFGWNQVVHDMCFDNELYGVTTINKPEDMRDLGPAEEIYVYAAFLPPGLHKCLIYEPESGRAFTKSFLVDLNDFDFYPELPEQAGTGKRKKPVPDVWRKWISDTRESSDIAFQTDVGSKNFRPGMFITDREEIRRLKEVLCEYFDIIKVSFLHQIAFSKRYPQVDWDQALAIHAGCEAGAEGTVKEVTDKKS